jgi:chemotaxis protein CheC
MTVTYSDLQLDGLRELANIGAGTAAKALSQMLGLPVDIDVPIALALPVEEAIALAGDPDDERFGVLVPFSGELTAAVVLLIPAADAETLCGVFGVSAAGEDGFSALGEIGNILGVSYINALCQMSGLEMEPEPPQVVNDMLGAIMASVMLSHGDADAALVLDSALSVEGQPCSLSFMLLPTAGSAETLLGRIGLG